MNFLAFPCRCSGCMRQFRAITGRNGTTTHDGETDRWQRAGGADSQGSGHCGSASRGCRQTQTRAGRRTGRQRPGLRNLRAAQATRLRTGRDSLVFA